MKDIETKTAIVDFLIMIKENSSPVEERGDLTALNIDARREHVVKSFLKENRVVKLRKQPSNSTLRVDGTDISVTFEKNKYSNNRATGKWTISALEGKTYTYEENNSEIVKILTGSITALKRNNHSTGKYGTEDKDWLATIAIYFCITQEEGRLLEFLSFLAKNYDIIISTQADIVIEAIYKIITWQGDDFRESRRKIVRSSVPLFIQSELARNAAFEPGTPQNIALFTTNLDNFTIRKAVYNEIEEIERECTASGYNWKKFNNILDEKITQAEKKGALIKKSVLEGIKFARQGNQLFSEEITLDTKITQNADLINPDINLFFYEIIKLAAAFSLMNNTAKNKCLTTLITYAEDFSVSRRSVQECAILTLVYFLYEHFEFPATKAEISPEKIFEAAYCKVTYAMMDQLFDDLNKQSGNYFLEIIRSAYEKAIKHNARPLYFFYYHRVVDPKNKFISDCHQFRAATRAGTEDRISAYIKFAKSRILSNKDYTEWKNEKEYLYAMQSFFYGLANIAMICDQGKIEVLDLVKNNPDILCRQIAVDYHTRKSVFGDKNDLNGDLSAFIRSGDFYLLCGPIRLACCLNDPTLQISSDKLYITYGIKKSTLISDYQNWMIAEDGRFKLLLYKLLSVIKDFDYQAPDGKHCLVNCRFVNEKDFLNYDNVDIIAINKKLIELKEKST